jgi:hypothetical protein
LLKKKLFTHRGFIFGFCGLGVGRKKGWSTGNNGGRGLSGKV